MSLMQKVAAVIERDQMLNSGNGLLTAAMRYKLAEAQIVSGEVETAKASGPQGSSAQAGKGMENREVETGKGKGLETGKPVVAAAGKTVALEATGTESLKRDLSHDKTAAARIAIARQKSAGSNASRIHSFLVNALKG